LLLPTFNPIFSHLTYFFLQIHLLQGIVDSGKHLSSGILEGVAGVFVSPYEGAKKTGVSGFFKGVGRGVVGLVAKPLTGALDAVSSLTDGVASTADSLSGRSEVKRRRHPRMVCIYVQGECTPLGFRIF